MAKWFQLTQNPRIKYASDEGSATTSVESDEEYGIPTDMGSHDLLSYCAIKPSVSASCNYTSQTQTAPLPAKTQPTQYECAAGLLPRPKTQGGMHVITESGQGAGYESRNAHEDGPFTTTSFSAFGVSQGVVGYFLRQLMGIYHIEGQTKKNKLLDPDCGKCEQGRKWRIKLTSESGKIWVVGRKKVQSIHVGISKPMRSAGSQTPERTAGFRRRRADLNRISGHREKWVPSAGAYRRTRIVRADQITEVKRTSRPSSLAGCGEKCVPPAVAIAYQQLVTQLLALKSDSARWSLNYTKENGDEATQAGWDEKGEKCVPPAVAIAYQQLVTQLLALKSDSARWSPTKLN
ncbi:hypothetical protein BKA62DRAFT_761781 [Auriculariales sp. MPI-PUGE-AT-0066]|nr:hypothetical protein BKA62DRAFT_761781 [Auriculariales sp. MPI-PUGE-AT-0066]